MGKKNKRKRFLGHFKNYSHNYRSQHFYDNFSTGSQYIAESEQINKIALEVFGSLHFEVNARD